MNSISGKDFSSDEMQDKSESWTLTMSNDDEVEVGINDIPADIRQLYVDKIKYLEDDFPGEISLIKKKDGSYRISMDGLSDIPN